MNWLKPIILVIGLFQLTWWNMQAPVWAFEPLNKLNQKPYSDIILSYQHPTETNLSLQVLMTGVAGDGLALNDFHVQGALEEYVEKAAPAPSSSNTVTLSPAFPIILIVSGTTLILSCIVLGFMAGILFGSVETGLVAYWISLIGGVMLVIGGIVWLIVLANTPQPPAAARTMSTMAVNLTPFRF